MKFSSFANTAAAFFSMVKGKIIPGRPVPKFNLSTGSLEMLVTRQPDAGSNGLNFFVLLSDMISSSRVK